MPICIYCILTGLFQIKGHAPEYFEGTQGHTVHLAICAARGNVLVRYVNLDSCHSGIVLLLRHLMIVYCTHVDILPPFELVDACRC